jgi:hypothetical protein
LSKKKIKKKPLRMFRPKEAGGQETVISREEPLLLRCNIRRRNAIVNKGCFYEGARA